VPASPAAPKVVAKDVIAPALAVFSRAKHKLERVLAKGLRVSVRCLEACRVELALELDRKTAKRLRVAAAKAVVVGRATARLAAGKSERVTVKLTRKARKRLARSRSRDSRRIKLKLRTTASDAAGNARTVSGRVTLER
jgi:hypothetical protein